METILSDNIFISLDIQDLFQTLCDSVEKCYASEPSKEIRQNDGKIHYTCLIRTKFIIIQMIDEIYKELFQMDMEQDLEEEEELEEHSRSDDLYKKFKA